MSKRRIHFVDEDKLDIERTDEVCHECGSDIYKFYQKGWIWRSLLGRYCLNDECRRDSMDKSYVEDLIDDE